MSAPIVSLWPVFNRLTASDVTKQLSVGNDLQVSEYLMSTKVFSSIFGHIVSSLGSAMCCVCNAGPPFWRKKIHLFTSAHTQTTKLLQQFPKNWLSYESTAAQLSSCKTSNKYSKKWVCSEGFEITGHSILLLLLLPWHPGNHFQFDVPPVKGTIIIKPWPPLTITFNKRQA